MSEGWYEVTSYCACGASMQARGVGSLDASVELRAAFLRVHTGPGHGAATKEEARRARRRQLRRES